MKRTIADGLAAIWPDPPEAPSGPSKPLSPPGPYRRKGSDTVDASAGRIVALRDVATRLCRFCGESLAVHTGPGRPRDFCTLEHRRASDHVDRALRSLAEVAKGLSPEASKGVRAMILARIQEAIPPDNRRPRGEGGAFVKKKEQP